MDSTVALIAVFLILLGVAGLIGLLTLAHPVTLIVIGVTLLLAKAIVSRR